MCEATPYMEATTACCGISAVDHTLQCCITYIPQHGAFDLYLKCSTYIDMYCWAISNGSGQSGFGAKSQQ